MKKVLFIVFVLIILGNHNSKAQGFEQGAFMIGATIGQSYDVLYGFQAEYGISDKIGLGFDVSYTDDVPYFTKYTLVGYLLTGSYHFISQSKFDPFIRGGVGYFNWSNKSLDTLETAYHKAGIGGVLQVGARYFFSDKIAGKLMFGYPYYFEIGLEFKLN